MRKHRLLTERGYQRNKYLDALGIPIAKYGTNFCDRTDSRWKSWQKERREYGFDNRETWSFDKIYVEWLYSHMKMFVEVGGEFVDLNSDITRYKFKAKDGTENELTLEQAIGVIENACEKYLTSSEDLDEKENYVFSPEIMTLLGTILPDVWW